MINFSRFPRPVRMISGKINYEIRGFGNLGCGELCGGIPVDSPKTPPLPEGKKK
jgi:hypothetical protein